MKINVTRSSMPDFDEYINEIKDLWDSRWLTNMGAKHNQLQDELCNYLDVENVSLFTNGHLALESIIAAFELKGEVITTPYTFASTTHAIVRNKLKPVFCDINDKDYTIDVSKIESLITDKTCAIVPVHVYGSICDVNTIESIAKKHNLRVIYDAAHAFGVKYNERGIGSYGDASMFSFHATKVFNTIEGGAVTFKESDNLTEKLLLQKNFGIKDQDHILQVSPNAKMNEFQAAMGLCNLRHINDEISKRKNVVKRYQYNLSNVSGITIWREQDNVTHNYSYFPVLFEKDIFGKSRDEILSKLAQNGIIARKYFYPLTNKFECYEQLYGYLQTPMAEYISNNILTLPLYADLKLEEVDRICDIILN